MIRPIVFLKTLHVVSIAFWLICGGCGQKTADFSDGAHSGQAAEKKNSAENTAQSTVIAYYFHRTIRCIPCITVESVVAQTIEKAFPEQLADERLMWVRINLDDEGGEEYERQFEVSGSALVVAKVCGRNGMQYKKLTKVWELLSDPDALSKYVENEIDEYLNR